MKAFISSLCFFFSLFIIVNGQTKVFNQTFGSKSSATFICITGDTLVQEITAYIDSNKLRFYEEGYADLSKILISSYKLEESDFGLTWTKPLKIDGKQVWLKTHVQLKKNSIELFEEIYPQEQRTITNVSLTYEFIGSFDLPFLNPPKFKCDSVVLNGKWVAEGKEGKTSSWIIDKDGYVDIDLGKEVRFDYILEQGQFNRNYLVLRVKDEETIFLILTFEYISCDLFRAQFKNPSRNIARYPDEIRPNSSNYFIFKKVHD